MSIDYIKNLEKEQKFYATKEEVIEVYRGLDRPKGRVVIKKDVAFITFDGYGNAQFVIKNLKSNSEVDFIEEKELIVLDNHNKNFFEFLIIELWQGKSIGEKLGRLLLLIFLIYLFNVIIMFFSSEKNISAICTSLLSAVSVFVAIFSVFTANQQHFERVKKELFQNGKMVYYFSVDRNLTWSGLVAIFSALFGLAISKDSNDSFVGNPWNYIYLHDYSSRKGLLILFTNISFIMTYLTLRSLIEFYIKRPAEYQIGLMKDEFLNPKE